MLAAALDANRELARLTAELRGENERLRAENVLRQAAAGPETNGNDMIIEAIGT